MTHRSSLRRRRLSAVMILGVLAGALAATGPAQALAPMPTFSPYVRYDPGGAKALALGDFTGDGRTDVLVSVTDAKDTERPDRLYLFGQAPDGSLAQVEVIETTTGSILDAGVAAGDFDGDGRTDAAVATSGTVDVLLQRGGRLTAGQAVPNPGFRSLEAADVDGDGRSDIVGAGQPGLAVFRNAGGGTFSAPDLLSGFGAFDVQIGDVTGDGRRDIVACGHHVQVVAGLPGGGFAPPADYFNVPDCDRVALADVNSDGRTDISITWDEPPHANRLVVLPQQPNGTLGQPEDYPTAFRPSAVGAGDMNGDGRTDVVVLHALRGQVGIHTQGGDHTLDPERFVSIPTILYAPPAALSVGDVSGDGRADIVVAGSGQGLLVLLGRPAGPSTTTSTSLLQRPRPYGLPFSSKREIFGGSQSYALGAPTTSVAAGDFNGDGRTDLAAVTESYNPSEAGLKLSVLFQGGDGSLQRAVRFDTDAVLSNDGSTGPIAVAAGDLDGDGRDDVVVRMAGGVDVFLQRGGRFADRIYREMALGYRADIVDFDGDGKGDLVTSDNGIRVYRSLGAAVFAPPVVVHEWEASEDLAFGDVSGDGRPDIVAYSESTDGTYAPGSVLVYRQRADHSFEEAVGTYIGQRYGTVALGDFDGDGRLEVAASQAVNGGNTADKIQIFTPGPDGALSPVYELDDARYIAQLRAGDLDGDGLTDLVAMTEAGRLETWLQKGGRLVFDSGYYVRGMPAPSAVVLADVSGDGWLDAAAASYLQGVEVKHNVITEGAFHPLAPARILDTRAGVGAPAARLGPQQTIDLQVHGAGGVPPDATAVVMNVTVTEPTAGSVLTLWPASMGRPTASNLNFVAGQTVPNLVTVRIGFEGKVSLYNLAGSTHVIADVSGWYGVDYGDAGSRYTPVKPARVLDTRTGLGAASAKLGPSGTLGLQVTGRGGVPASGVTAVALNVTVTEPTAGSFLTAWPAGQSRPLASNLNYGAGQTVPNLVVVKVGAGGVVNLFNYAGATHVIADVAGWFGAGPRAPTGSFVSVGPGRIVDTRYALGAPRGKVGPGGTLTIQVAGAENLAPPGAIAVVLNVTVTEPTAGSFLTVWPHGEARPLASSLNYDAGQTVPNLVVVKVGAGGQIDLFNHSGSTHAVVDVAGWYRA